jgi:hypothetical protein
MNNTLIEPTVRKNPANREGAAKTSREVTPRLACIVTGKSRLTNAKYLASKPEGFVTNYISRPALKLLRTGKNVQQVRAELGVTEITTPISDSAIQNAIKINGKWSKQS